MDKIVLTWEEHTVGETAHVGAMYCFHSCDINRN